MTRALVALAVAATVASVVACGGEKAKPSTTRTVGATATAGAVATPTVQARRTGIAEVDAVIDAVLSGNLDAIMSLMRLTDVPCVATPEPLSGDLPCPAGKPAGTLVKALPMASCEGGYVPGERVRHDIESLLGYRLTGESNVYGVYRAAGSGFDDSFFSRASPEYAVVFAMAVDTQTDAWALLVRRDGIVGVENGCAQTAPTFISEWRLTDVVLPPP